MTRHRQTFSVAVMALLLAAIPEMASGQVRAPIRQMEASTVRILMLLRDKATGKDGPVSTGSGFMIGEDHVATNAHVADPRFVFELFSENEKQLVGPGIQNGDLTLVAVVPLTLSDVVPLTLVWSSVEQDLAVLKLDRRIGRPFVTFARERFVETGDDVIAVGFPGAADQNSRDEDALVPTVTRGALSRFTLDQGGTKHFQIDAPINSGNSGGPLFNACGQVIGVNVAKATTKVGSTDQVAVAEGVGWSIRADLLLDALDRLRVPYQQTDVRCEPSPAASDRLPHALVALSLLLGSVGIGLGATRRGRSMVVERARTVGHTVAAVRNRATGREGQHPPVAAAGVSHAMLHALGGPYKDSAVEVGDTPLSIGRDPRVSQLVFPPDAVTVSKRHCTIRFDAPQRRFTLEDCWSVNGTYLDSGERIAPDTPRTLRPGERFYVGDRTNLFEVRLDS